MNRTAPTSTPTPRTVTRSIPMRDAVTRNPFTTALSALLLAVLILSGTALSPAAPRAQAVPTATPQTLTHTLYNAVIPNHPLEWRKGWIERGEESGDVLEKIGKRADKMFPIVKPKVVGPVKQHGTKASGRLEVTLPGSNARQHPLTLHYFYQGNRWKLTARTVCDIAAFQGISCPANYVK